MLASISGEGKMEYACAWACPFNIDNKVSSSCREFKLDKVHLDIDGAASTQILSYTMRLRVRILRRGDSMAPNVNDEILAEEFTAVTGPGIHSCDFGGSYTISHRYKARYWLVVKPVAVSISGEAVSGAKWYWRCQQATSHADDDMDMLACSRLGDVDIIDANDLCANTTTQFTPKRQGVEITGIDSWNDWNHYRCIQCSRLHQETLDDASRFGEQVVCHHHDAFAYSVKVSHPNSLKYTAEKSYRLLQEEQEVADKQKSPVKSEEKRVDFDRIDSMTAPEDQYGTETINILEDDIKIGQEGQKNRNHQNVIDAKSVLELQKKAEAEKESFSTADFEQLVGHIEVDFGYNTTKSQIGRYAIGCLKTSGIKISKISRQCRHGLLGQCIFGPISLAVTLLRLFFLLLVYFFWAVVIIFGIIIWFAISLLLSIYGLCNILVSERHVIFLFFHVKILRCTKKPWYWSFNAFLGIILFGLCYGFIIDPVMSWSIENILLQGNQSILEYIVIKGANYRFLYLAPVLLIFVTLYAIRGAPLVFYDLERFDATKMQNVRYEIAYRNGETIVYSGIVLQRFDTALAIVRESENIVDIVHMRQLLRVGVPTSQSGSLNNITEPSSTETKSKGGTKTADTNSSLSDKSRTRIYMTSGMHYLKKDLSSWKPWILKLQGKPSKTVPPRLHDSAAFYDRAFGPFLLRYVLTTGELPNFNAHRNALMLVNETRKLYSTHNELVYEHRDMKNSYINAFMILMLSLHLSLTKRVVSIFLCSEQPNGAFTLIEDPETTCYDVNGNITTEYLRLSALGYFFFALYVVGIPASIVSVLSGIFGDQKECDPSCRDRYGYLYYKYTNANYLWEPFVILPRKSLMTIIRMYTQDGGIGLHRLQAAAGLLLTGAFALFHLSRKPFIEDFLNNMESIALLNNIFVLFAGLCFLSDSIRVENDSPQANDVRENIFASVMIGSMVITIAFLLKGVLKELWEGGVISMGSKG
eukprot:g1318.t1